MQQDTLIVGDTLSFLTVSADYPADAGWVLHYYLVSRATGPTGVELTSTAEGAAHRITVDASVTATWTPGNYSWAVRAIKAAEKYSVETLRRQLEVLQNPATAVAGFDGRSRVHRAYEAALDALAAWTPTTRKYRINGREMEFSTKADAVGCVHYWQNELAKERRHLALDQGRPDPRKSFVRLNRE